MHQTWGKKRNSPIIPGASSTLSCHPATFTEAERDFRCLDEEEELLDCGKEYITSFPHQKRSFCA